MSLLTEGAAPADAGTPPPQATNGAAPPDGATAALNDAVADSQRPEWAPEKFWDPEAKAVRYEDLGKSYSNLEKLLGREKIPVPTGDEDVEGWNRAYTALGRPEKPDDYEFERPSLPEDLPYDEDAEKSFRQWAHEQGLNKRQARAFYDKFVKYQTERHVAYVDHQRQQRAQAEHAFRRELGTRYEAEIAKAKAAIERYADPGYIKWLDESGQGNNPEVVRSWIRVGNEMVGEAKLKGGQAPSATPADAQKAIADFRSKHQKELFDRNHPDHEARVREMTRLFEAAHPQ